MGIEIATTIQSQIGRPAFAMMGAKNLTAGERSLSWKLGGGAKARASHVTVTLDADDTYTVETLRCSVKIGRKVLESVSGVYFDTLRTVIEAQTGFYLSL